MKDNSVGSGSSFANDFYSLLQSVIQDDIKSLTKTDARYPETAKKILEYDSCLATLNKFFMSMLFKAEVDSDMRNYCKELTELITDLSIDNLHELNRKLDKVRKGTAR